MRRTVIIIALSLGALMAPLGLASSAGAAEPGPEAALTGVAQLEAGDDHTCVVLTSQEARCWGYGGWRQLGNGLGSSPGIPNAVLNSTGTAPMTGITQVSAGSSHTCARLANGKARCWGYNQDGELGVGDQATRTFPVTVKGVGGTGRLTDVAEVSSGWNHTCARVGGGEVRCWGANNQGQIGDDTISLRSSATVVLAPTGPGPLTGATQIATGVYISCARLNTGQAVCWGNNGNYQLGDGTNAQRRRPVFVRNPANTGPLTGVRRIAVGDYYACALLTTGQARCWGNAPGGASTLPTGVLNANGGAQTGIASLSAGQGHLCFRLTTGRVRCMGKNDVGQLGDLTTMVRTRPVPMVNTAGTSSAVGVTAVAAGQNHTCALLDTAQVMCTGANDLGQLGAGPGPNTARPIGVRR